MKTFILILLGFLTHASYNYLSSQENATGGDIGIFNSSSKNIWVRVYPVSMVFNVHLNEIGNYDFHAVTFNDNFKYINGKGGGENVIDGKHKLLTGGGPNSIAYWNMEGVTAASGSVAGIGRGVYRFEFFYDNINNLVDSVIVEWDAGDFGDLSLVFE